MALLFQSSAVVCISSAPQISAQQSFRSLKQTGETEQVVSWNPAINYSGRQRMYTQKMSKEALLIFLDHDAEYYLRELGKTRDKYQFVQDGLISGESALAIPPAPNQEFLDQIAIIDDIWQPFVAAINIITAQGYVNASEMDVIAQFNVPLLQENNRLVGMYESYASENSAGSAEATAPEILSAINLAGRQRMLVQRMVKEYYLVLAGYDPEANAERTLGTAALFDDTLDGLEFGDESMNLAPAPTEDILYWIHQVRQVWDGEYGLKKIIVEKPSYYKISIVAEKNIPILGRMNVIVGLYENPGSDLVAPPPAETIDQDQQTNPASEPHQVGLQLLVGFLTMLSAVIV